MSDSNFKELIMNHKAFLFRAVALSAFFTIFGSSFAQGPCKLRGQAQATLVHTGKVVCALESTIHSWERRGFAVLTSRIASLPQTTLAEEGDSTLLEECDGNHVKVRLTDIDDAPSAFCVTESIIQRWLQEGIAFELDKD